MSNVITANFKYNLLLMQRICISNSIKTLTKPYSHFKLLRKEYSHKSELLTSPFILYSHQTLRNIHEDGLIRRTLKRIKYHLITKQRLKQHACIFYTKIEQEIDLEKFFDLCQLPDTFYSWYLVTELHLWMLCVRFMAEAEQGKILRDTLLTSLWIEIEERSKKLEGLNPSSRKRQAMEICEHFRASFFSYDEALSGDDKVLASALWRVLFHKNCKDPERIECCVNYVRKNLAYLDSIPCGELMFNFRFLPLLECNKLSNG